MSDEKEVKNTEEEVIQDEQGGAQAGEEQEVEEKTAEPTPEERFAELNNKYVRIHAEFDNFRKRTNREKLDIISNANAGVLKDLLPVVDDFERAIANNESAEDIESVKEGFNLIFNKFKSILEGKGLKPMDAMGTTFDSEIHEAIANIPAPEESMKGKVMDVVEKGYSLNEKVVRYAKVVVGQ